MIITTILQLKNKHFISFWKFSSVWVRFSNSSICLDHLLCQLSVHRSQQSIMKTVSGLSAIFPECFKPGNGKKQKGVSCQTLKKSFKIPQISFDVFNSIQKEGTFLFSIFLLVSCTYQKVIKLFHIWNLLINVHINVVLYARFIKLF